MVRGWTQGSPSNPRIVPVRDLDAPLRPLVRAAADLLAAERGDAGILAGDVADALPATLRRLRETAARDPRPLLRADDLGFPEPR